MEAHSPTPLLLSGGTPKENLTPDGVGHPLGYHLDDAPDWLSVPNALVEEFRRVSSMEYYTRSL